jgi:hypothetical protein
MVSRFHWQRSEALPGWEFALATLVGEPSEAVHLCALRRGEGGPIYLIGSVVSRMWAFDLALRLVKEGCLDG